jgi:hypothetical protein
MILSQLVIAKIVSLGPILAVANLSRSRYFLVSRLLTEFSVGHHVNPLIILIELAPLSKHK